MSLCTPCIPTFDVPTCTTNLTIGTVTVNDTDVLVYIKDLTVDGHPQQFDITTGGSGEVVIDLSQAPEFMPDHSYEVWVTLASATSIEDGLDITVQSETENCVQLRFVYVTDEAKNNIAFTDQTLKLKP